MMIEMIQPGWVVADSNGDEIGKVTSVDEQSIHVHRGGFGGGHDLAIPRSACAYAEEGRVELSMTKKEVESRH